MPPPLMALRLSPEAAWGTLAVIGRCVVSEHAIVEQVDVVRGLIRALRTKSFLILAGLSGTGKTQLARRLSQAVVAIDQEQGKGQGLVQLEKALDDAAGGNNTAHFSPAGDHAGYVRVHDVGSGGKRAKAASLWEKRVGFLPVRPDWTDAKSVWGYYNPLTGRFYPTDALVVLLNAFRDYMEHGENAGRHFLVLDEMNLARVEYYFSDLLSLMESGCSADPDVNNRIRLGAMARIHPLDTLIVSTGQRGVHDERTAMDAHAAYGDNAPGVTAARTGTVEQMVPLRELDTRRWIYEPLVKGLDFADRPTAEIPPMDPKRDTLAMLFPIPPRVACPPNLIVIGMVNVDETTHAFAPKVLDRAFVMEFNEVNYAVAFERHPAYEATHPLLQALHDALSPSNHHFGYRVAGEMLGYVTEAGGTLTTESADFLILSKVLPKLRGTEQQLRKPLEALRDVCADQKAPRAGAKVDHMLTQLDESGFASFF